MFAVAACSQGYTDIGDAFTGDGVGHFMYNPLLSICQLAHTWFYDRLVIALVIHNLGQNV